MLPPLLERDRNGLRLLVVVHQFGLLDVEQGGQRLIGGAGHLVVPGGNRRGGLALGVLGGVLADLAVGVQVDQRRLGEQLQIGQVGQILLVDDRGALGLDADADADDVDAVARSLLYSAQDFDDCVFPVELSESVTPSGELPDSAHALACDAEAAASITGFIGAVSVPPECKWKVK